MAKKPAKAKNNNGVTLDIENELWEAADKMRGHLDAAEYKSVVLGLIFLKYISDIFEKMHEKIEKEGLDDPEDKDVYLAERVFWVPADARWKILQDNAAKDEIGNLIDTALEAIEKDNPTLKNMLPTNYGRATLDKRRLGDLVTMVSNKINFADEESRKQDTLGRVYEYFLSNFAMQEGRKGGEFYTPRSVVRVLVEMLAPYKGRVFDPCCGSGGMFVQSEKFVEAHGGKIGDLSVYGQESNPNTFKLAKMNLAIRGIDGDLGKEPADSFLKDQHPDLKADYILANPPFNMSDWGGELLKDDKRWEKYGKPPINNANFAWVQHFIHHLSPSGAAGFVLANGSMSSNTSGEGEIRKAIIEDDLVDCMVALPGQLFYSTQIPVCLWFLTRKKQNRNGKTLFINARKIGTLTDRVHRDLSGKDISQIANTYHAWKAGKKYEDISGFCKSVTIEEIRAQGYGLTPGRYVGAVELEEDDEPFNEKMARLTKELEAQFEEGEKLEKHIRESLKKL